MAGFSFNVADLSKAVKTVLCSKTSCFILFFSKKLAMDFGDISFFGVIPAQAGIQINFS